MALHLLKLAVGVDSLDSLRVFRAQQAATAAASGHPYLTRHRTRMAPRRVDEVLAGGSLYWVIKGALQGRQEIVGFDPFKDADGIQHVHILLNPEVVAVKPRPCRPFQGWRYLAAADAPADWLAAAPGEDIPATMRRDLMELCLI